MQLMHVLLVAAATLLISGVASVVVDQAKLLKVQTVKNRADPNHPIHSKGNRRLRVHGDNTADEERTANNLLDIFDKRWFGVVKNSAVNVAVKSEKTASNNYVVMFGDFAPVTIGRMIRDDAFKDFMFKRWDLVAMENIKPSIVKLLKNEFLSEEQIAKLVVDYVQNHRDYSKFKAPYILAL
ncbi:RxLR effector protein [Phytophthora megakarya]|uniref:RxLR effector protein n=1 Tax=Phytophthora megakarya TaxID=4795 RepID=A0A225V4S4_9STRA|nr:RxLR effector protein [Phytophthora megakarya]